MVYYVASCIVVCLSVCLSVCVTVLTAGLFASGSEWLEATRPGLFGSETGRGWDSSGLGWAGKGLWELSPDSHWQAGWRAAS